jgi:hypothetical protein
MYINTQHMHLLYCTVSLHQFKQKLFRQIFVIIKYFTLSPFVYPSDIFGNRVWIYCYDTIGSN